MPETENITQLLQAARQGNESAAGELMEAVYTDLRRLARSHMAAERSGHTLQPTAVVNEVFLKMFKPVGATDWASWQLVQVDWKSRAHFLGVAAKQMRKVLIDHARRKRAAKRGSVRISLEDAGALAVTTEAEFDTIDELLNLLATKDPSAAKVVELKFFGGLTDKEAAHVMGVNVAKLRRDWEFARAWLRQKLSDPKPAPKKVE